MEDSTGNYKVYFCVYRVCISIKLFLELELFSAFSQLLYREI